MKYKIINSLDELNEKLQELNHSDDAELKVIQIKSLGKLEPISYTHISDCGNVSCGEGLIKRSYFEENQHRIHAHLKTTTANFVPGQAALSDGQKNQLQVLTQFLNRKGIVFYPVEDNSDNHKWLYYLYDYLFKVRYRGEIISSPLPLFKVAGKLNSKLMKNLNNVLVWTQYYPFGNELCRPKDWGDQDSPPEDAKTKFMQLRNHVARPFTGGDYSATPIDTVKVSHFDESKKEMAECELLTAFAFPEYDRLMIFAPPALCEALLKLLRQESRRGKNLSREKIIDLFSNVNKEQLDKLEKLPAVSEEMSIPDSIKITALELPLDYKKKPNRAPGQVHYEVLKAGKEKRSADCGAQCLIRMLILHYTTHSDIHFIYNNSQSKLCFPKAAYEEQCLGGNCEECKGDCDLLCKLWGSKSNISDSIRKLTPHFQYSQKTLLAPSKTKLIRIWLTDGMKISFAEGVFEQLSQEVLNLPEGLTHANWQRFIEILTPPLSDC